MAVFTGTPEEEEAYALAWAEAYARGHFVATQRAISRQELGLPLEYGKPCPDGPDCIGCLYDQQLPESEHRAALERIERETPYSTSGEPD